MFVQGSVSAVLPGPYLLTAGSVVCQWLSAAGRGWAGLGWVQGGRAARGVQGLPEPPSTEGTQLHMAVCPTDLMGKRRAGKHAGWSCAPGMGLPHGNER